MPEKDLIIIGEIIKQTRTEKNMSQETLAVRAECSVRTIRKVEKGEQNTSILKILKIIDVLGITMVSLLSALIPAGEQEADGAAELTYLYKTGSREAKQAMLVSARAFAKEL